MTLMSTLRAFLSDDRRDPAPSDVVSAKVDAAIHVADELAEQTRAVNDKLKGYLDKRDPFMQLLIDISNERAMRAQIRQWDDD